MNKSLVIIPLLVIGIIAGAIVYNRFKSGTALKQNTQLQEKGLTEKPNPLSIEYMRLQEYPGSDIVIEQTLADGSNYHRYIASYKSEGLKIYALLTVPFGEKPQTGWPVIIFNHGYIRPEDYKTTEKYVAYTDAFSRNGYIVFKPDYRGHGNSEGKPEGAYFSPAYTIDVLNAVASIKKLKSPSTGSGSVTDANRIGMWGHSMGGMITLRSMVVSKDIKAVEIWHRSCCFTDKRNALLSYSGLFGELLRADFEIG